MAVQVTALNSHDNTGIVAAPMPGMPTTAQARQAAKQTEAGCNAVSLKAHATAMQLYVAGGLHSRLQLDTIKDKAFAGMTPILSLLKLHCRHAHLDCLSIQSVLMRCITEPHIDACKRSSTSPTMQADSQSLQPASAFAVIMHIA